MNKPYKIQKRVWRVDFMLPVWYYSEGFNRLDFIREPEYPKMREDITWLELSWLNSHESDKMSRWRNKELLEWLNGLKL